MEREITLAVGLTQLQSRYDAQMMAAMDMRLTLCADEVLATITVEEMMRNGFYRGEAIERLAAERTKRGLR